ncbi:MAG: undecaprenyl/decaprenyl-phosphate alpha-N-acetylglucosaminyl 1-phosphate transferase [Candidatus Coatesbacteria bacterium]|nr:undecaprenyl/decaprenyl-phosphate alpha-N-acetylglucosaminyl 1-phosphate transferase [Candidatus Coatesbacteria bacterium]
MSFEQIIRLSVPALISFVIALILTPLMRIIAMKLKIMDIPNSRKVHKDPKPYLGGVAIFVAFNVTLVLALLYGTPLIHRTREIIAIMSGGSIIFIVGLYDDIKGVAPKIKLLWQIIAAFVAGIILMMSGVQMNLFAPGGLDLLSGTITLIWIVGITNSFNLLDNMDGLTAGLGVICSFFLFQVAFQREEILLIFLPLAVLGSSLGFWFYNKNPARIFMGDCGALFIGFNLAVFSLMGIYNYEGLTRYIAILTPILILSIPIFDTISVIIIRLKRRVSIFHADTNHISHRLVYIGMSHRNAVYLIYMISVTMGIIGLFLPKLSPSEAILLLLHAFLVYLLIVILMLTASKNKNK